MSKNILPRMTGDAGYAKARARKALSRHQSRTLRILENEVKLIRAAQPGRDRRKLKEEIRQRDVEKNAWDETILILRRVFRRK